MVHPKGTGRRSLSKPTAIEKIESYNTYTSILNVSALPPCRFTTAFLSCIFKDARYLHTHSTFGNIVVGEEHDQNLALYLQTTTDSITKYYFPDICKDALHVIYSIPVWTSSPKPNDNLPLYAFTSLAFHTYSEIEVTRQNWPHIPAGTEPALIVFGMTAFRPMPSSRLDVSTSWISGSSLCTIGVSHRVFTHERLLSLLSRVNALTTLIPLNSGAGDSLEQAFLNLRLQSWADHEHGKHRPCMFELQHSEERVRRYLWKYSEEWKYDRRGNSSIPSASYEVSCKRLQLVCRLVWMTETFLRL